MDHLLLGAPNLLIPSLIGASPSDLTQDQLLCPQCCITGLDDREQYIDIYSMCVLFALFFCAFNFIVVGEE